MLHLSKLMSRALSLAGLLLCAALIVSACSPLDAAALPALPAQPAASATPTPFGPPTRTPEPGAPPIPLFAYYYIWFDQSSWAKNKVDWPQLGRYSSDDPAIMQQHILWAKSAGIDAFIVSWKSTDKLNSRLDQLVKLADSSDFKLAINYEGLDQNRDPLPASQVAADLDYFIQHFASNPAFKIYDKPMVIWAGTWKFSTADIASVTQVRRDKLMILASDRDVPGIQRLKGLIDGDAYYFSSVNPDTFPHYQDKLNAMSSEVHAQGGLWIAPAAPGFDARLIGGTTIVDRKDGQTLTVEMNAAMKSSPDAIGIISWNEFTENSYIEPSQKYGRRYLDILTSVGEAPVPQINGFDSSDPGSGPQAFIQEALALGLLAALVIGGAIAIARRH